MPARWKAPTTPLRAALRRGAIFVYAWKGMSQADYDEHMHLMRGFEADWLREMGGELSVVHIDKDPPIGCAREASTSGPNVLSNHQVPFPIC